MPRKLRYADKVIQLDDEHDLDDLCEHVTDLLEGGGGFARVIDTAGTRRWLLISPGVPMMIEETPAAH